METRPLSFGRKSTYAALVVIAFLALLEGVSALLFPRRPSLCEVHEKIITILGLPEMNRILEYDRRLFWRVKRKIDGAEITGTIKGQPVDFTVSSNERGERTGRRGAEGTFRILAVGNSCTFGVGVDGGATWPARLESILRDGGVDAEVINAGVPGYTSFQGLRYLEEEGLRLRPDLVIACFGFNDAEEWGEKGDREIAAGLARRGIDRFFSRSRFYALLKGGIGRLRRGAAAGGGKPRPRVSAEEFYRNLLEMKRLCASRGAELILLVWPYRKQRINGERRLIVYQPLIERAGREGRIPVVSLIDPFLDAEESPYLDHIHANEEGCRLVAEVVAETISRARIR